jgi:hypothetical protein
VGGGWRVGMPALRSATQGSARPVSRYADTWRSMMQGVCVWCGNWCCDCVSAYVHVLMTKVAHVLANVGSWCLVLRRHACCEVCHAGECPPCQQPKKQCMCLGVCVHGVVYLHMCTC